MIKKYLTILLAFSVLIFAKSNIKFNNMVFLSDEFAKEAIEYDENEEMSKEQINNALKKLYSFGYFKNINVTITPKKDIKYIFNFTPKNSIKTITFDGDLDDENKDKAHITLKQTDKYDEYDLINLESEVDKYYQNLGYFDSKINIEEDTENFSSNLKIKSKEGKKISLTKIYIKGNNHKSDKEIKNSLLLKEKSFFYIPLLTNSGDVETKKLKLNENFLKEIYLKSGFLDVEIKSHTLVLNTQDYTAKLFISINEGKRYIVDKTNVNLASNIKDYQHLLKQIKNNLHTKHNITANINNIRADMQSIKLLLNNKGYAFAQIAPDIQKENNKLNITYNILPGNLTIVKDVIISGNKYTQDNVIRRNIYLAPNDIYNEKDYQDSINALKRTGFFDSVTIEKVQELNNKVTLIVKVKESLGISFNLGGGHDSKNGLFISGSIKTSNTFGSGISNSLKATIGNKAILYNYKIANPRLFNSLYSFDFNIYHTQENKLDFDKNSSGTSMNFGRSINRYLSLSSNIKFDTSDVNASKYESNTFDDNSISLDMTFNNTNNYLFPSKGAKAFLSLEKHGIYGDLDFIRIDAKASIFQSLNIYAHKKIIFSYSAHIINLLENETIPSYKRLKIGGLHSVRGLELDSVYPKIGKTIGGLNVFSTSAEFSIPLYGDKIRGAIYADFATIGNRNFTEIQKATYGASIQVMAGMIPIIFLFPQPLLTDKNDVVKNFEFLIGTSF